MSGVDVFLSYARADRATARVIATGLRDAGLHVWWDASLHSGETFDEVIERNLKEAKAVVVLWSPASVSSRWVRAEATLADRRNKLVPAVIETCDRPIIFELTHTSDLTGWAGDLSDARWTLFLDDLQRLVDAEKDEGRVIEGTAREAVPPGPRDEDRSAPSMRLILRTGNDEVIRSPNSSVYSPAAPSERAYSSHPASETHCLEVEEGDVGETLIVVDSSTVKIGRAAPADIVLPHKSISREHCVVGLANDELFVTDLNSTNGTYIDEERIIRPTILPVGSIVRIGQISLRHAIHSWSEAERRQQVTRAQRAIDRSTGRLAAMS